RAECPRGGTRPSRGELAEARAILFTRPERYFVDKRQRVYAKKGTAVIFCEKLRLSPFSTRRCGRRLCAERAGGDDAVAAQKSLILSADRAADGACVTGANHDRLLGVDRKVRVGLELAFHRLLSVGEHADPDGPQRHDLCLQAARWRRGRSGRWHWRGRLLWR